MKDLAPGTNPPFLLFNGVLKTDFIKIEEFLEATLAPPRYLEYTLTHNSKFDFLILKSTQMTGDLLLKCFILGSLESYLPTRVIWISTIWLNVCGHLTSPQVYLLQIVASKHTVV